MTATVTPSASPPTVPAASPEPPGVGRTTRVGPTVGAVARRTILQYVRTPQLMVMGMVQGAMFLLIFRYVFGGAISAGPVPYVDFLVPGFVVTSVLFTGMMASVGVAEDIEHGFFDRLRSLPVHRTALLTGRALADTLLLTLNLAITTAIGFLVGFRLHGSWLEGLAAFGLCVLVGATFSWVFISLGLIAGNAQAAQGMAMLIMPLTFVSSAYVPVDTMPSWLQPIAEHQPITIMVNSVRSLCLGDPALAGLPNSTGYYVALTFVWCAILVAVFAPLAVWRYRRG